MSFSTLDLMALTVKMVLTLPNGKCRLLPKHLTSRNCPYGKQLLAKDSPFLETAYEVKNVFSRSVELDKTLLNSVIVSFSCSFSL